MVWRGVVMCCAVLWWCGVVWYGGDSDSGVVLVMMSDEVTVGVGQFFLKRYLDVVALCVMLRHLPQNNYHTS